MSDALKTYITGTLGGKLQHGSDEALLDCVHCGKEDHMYVNIVSGLSYCFKCAYSANLTKLLVDVKGSTFDDAKKLAGELLRDKHVTRQKLENYAGASSHATSALSRVLDAFPLGQKTKYTGKGEVIPLPDHTELVTSHDQREVRSQAGKAVVRYLTKRGFNPAYICTPIYAAQINEFGPYVLIPDFWDKGYRGLRYWTGRRATDDLVGTNGKKLHKSYNPRNVTRPALFGGYALTTKTPILVEGPFDWLALRGSALCTLGKSVNTEAAAQIARAYRRVYIFLDRDADAEALMLRELLERAGCRAEVFHWSGLPNKYTKCKDAADFVQQIGLTPEELASLVRRHSTVPTARHIVNTVLQSK